MNCLYKGMPIIADIPSVWHLTTKEAATLHCTFSVKQASSLFFYSTYYYKPGTQGPRWDWSTYIWLTSHVCFAYAFFCHFQICCIKSRRQSLLHRRLLSITKELVSLFWTITEVHSTHNQTYPWCSSTRILFLAWSWSHDSHKTFSHHQMSFHRRTFCKIYQRCRQAKLCTHWDNTP